MLFGDGIYMSQIRVKCDKAGLPKVDALLTVFQDGKNTSSSIVEFRNLNSDFFEFKMFFEGVWEKYFL